MENYLDCQDGSHLVSMNNMVARSADVQGALMVLNLWVAEAYAWVVVWEENLEHPHPHNCYSHHLEVHYAHPAGHQK
jgi:hypothetical protein